MYYSNFVKKNHRVPSKISDVFFSVEFRSETKIGCFFLQVAIHPHIFPIYNDNKSIVERTPHSHIQRYFSLTHDPHKGIFLSILFCQHYCNYCSFLLFHFFFFKFFFPIVDIIVNHLYLLFLGSRKTNTKCDKNEKIPTVISSWRS